MLVRDFSNYEWEEEVQKLEMPHFYIGKYYTFTLILKLNLICNNFISY